MYEEKKRSYFTSVRKDILEHLVLKPTYKVLEIGAGGCDTLVYLKQNKMVSEVVAVELFHIPSSNQNNPVIDKLIIGDVSSLELDYPEKYFDVVICGDVLEHLIDPWSVVERLSFFLKKGGIFAISCPNIREIVNLLSILIKGDFAYQQSGIMDRTHLRFFCKKNLEDMMRTDSLRIFQTIPNYGNSHRRKRFSRFHFGKLDGFLAPQYIVISEKY